MICLGLLWMGNLPERVMEAVFAAALFTVVLLGIRQHRSIPGWLRRGGIVAGAAVFLLCSAVSMARVANRLAMPRVNTIENETTGVQSVDIAATDEEHVYVWNIYSAYNRVQQAYGLTALPERDFFSNNTILGGYHEHSPYMKKSRALWEFKIPCGRLWRMKTCFWPMIMNRSEFSDMCSSTMNRKRR